MSDRKLITDTAERKGYSIDATASRVIASRGNTYVIAMFHPGPQSSRMDRAEFYRNDMLIWTARTTQEVLDHL